MTELRIELLESIGFTWAKAKGDDCWNERFNDLAEYKKLVGTYCNAVNLCNYLVIDPSYQHNHCDVKTKGDVQVGQDSIMFSSAPRLYSLLRPSSRETTGSSGAGSRHSVRCSREMSFRMTRSQS